MNNYKEPIPLFKEGDVVLYGNLPAVVLSITTYCVCCDRFLDTAKYAIKYQDQRINHRVHEDELRFPEDKNNE